MFGVRARMAVSLLAASAALGLLVSCGSTDVVAKYAKTSFKALIAASGDRARGAEEGGYWLLSSQAGDEARFSKSASGGPDFALSLDAAPFLAAGLDPSRLAPVAEVGYRVEAGRLVLEAEFGTAAAGSSESLEKAFDAIVASYRSRIGYHEALDHYGLKIGAGNMFEWAKDLAKNDKDLVFVLDPKPLAAAGMDPKAVEGWIFASVEMKDDSGKLVSEDKLLRPFDLK